MFILILSKNDYAKLTASGYISVNSGKIQEHKPINENPAKMPLETQKLLLKR